jgi:hypothetical protein
MAPVFVLCFHSSIVCSSCPVHTLFALCSVMSSCVCTVFLSFTCRRIDTKFCPSSFLTGQIYPKKFRSLNWSECVFMWLTHNYRIHFEIAVELNCSFEHLHENWFIPPLSLSLSIYIYVYTHIASSSSSDTEGQKHEFHLDQDIRYMRQSMHHIHDLELNHFK